jgi:hypothetical protein
MGGMSVFAGLRKLSSEHSNCFRKSLEQTQRCSSEKNFKTTRKIKALLYFLAASVDLHAVCLFVMSVDVMRVFWCCRLGRGGGGQGGDPAPHLPGPLPAQQRDPRRPRAAPWQDHRHAPRPTRKSSRAKLTRSVHTP